MNDTRNNIAIAAVCYSNLRLHQAQEFCRANALPLLRHRSDKHELQLLFHDDLVELFDRQLNTSIAIDFIRGTLAHRQQYGGGRGQALAKAIGLKSGATPTVLDATAGMAGDAFVLATLGCPVTMLERSAIIHCLIENAIERASLGEHFQAILQRGFHLVHRDAIDYISEQQSTNGPAPDVIYLDPMYPERKKSALVKKDMQVLQRLHGSDDNAAELLERALLFAGKRVVVKRPIHAEAVSDRKPDTCIKSKKTRYDIYTIKK